MTDDYETSWTFRKPNHFWTLLNKQIDLSGLNDSQYRLLFFTSIPDDFNDIINSYGCMKDNGYTLVNPNYYDRVNFDLKMDLIDNGENGFRLSIDNNNVTDIAIETPFYLKAVALVKNTGTMAGNDYVVAYSRLSTPIYCKNSITLPSYCEFVGHASCKEV